MSHTVRQAVLYLPYIHKYPALAITCRNNRRDIIITVMSPFNSLTRDFNRRLKVRGRASYTYVNTSTQWITNGYTHSFTNEEFAVNQHAMSMSM